MSNLLSKIPQLSPLFKMIYYDKCNTTKKSDIFSSYYIFPIMIYWYTTIDCRICPICPVCCSACYFSLISIFLILNSIPRSNIKGLVEVTLNMYFCHKRDLNVSHLVWHRIWQLISPESWIWSSTVSGFYNKSSFYIWSGTVYRSGNIIHFVNLVRLFVTPLDKLCHLMIQIYQFVEFDSNQKIPKILHYP